MKQNRFLLNRLVTITTVEVTNFKEIKMQRLFTWARMASRNNIPIQHLVITIQVVVLIMVRFRQMDLVRLLFHVSLLKLAAITSLTLTTWALSKQFNQLRDKQLFSKMITYCNQVDIKKQVFCLLLSEALEIQLVLY